MLLEKSAGAVNTHKMCWFRRTSAVTIVAQQVGIRSVILLFLLIECTLNLVQSGDNVNFAVA